MARRDSESPGVRNPIHGMERQTILDILLETVVDDVSQVV
jgi:hypothetical protein